jgi:hypothetical protein
MTIKTRFLGRKIKIPINCIIADNNISFMLSPHLGKNINFGELWLAYSFRGAAAPLVS